MQLERQKERLLVVSACYQSGAWLGTHKGKAGVPSRKVNE